MSEVKGEQVACSREIAGQKEQEMPRVWAPVQRRCRCWRERRGGAGCLRVVQTQRLSTSHVEMRGLSLEGKGRVETEVQVSSA